LALNSLLAALDRLTGCREALVIADEQAWREEREERTDECADARATRALLRAAANAVWLLETAAARAEALHAHTASTLASTQRALERADHVCAALELASGLRRAHSIELMRACTVAGLYKACYAHHVGALNLGLVFVESLESLKVEVETEVEDAALLRLLFACVECRKDTPAAAATIQRLLECKRIAHVAGRDRTTDRFTVLMCASINGLTLCVKALLACPYVRATAAYTNEFGRTALGLASVTKHSDTVAALLACPEVREAAGTANEFKNTALMLATPSARTMRVLLACPEVQRTAGEADATGMTALMHACDSSAHEVETAAAIRELLACPEVQRTAGEADATGRTALMLACLRVHAVDAIRELLACPEVRRTAGAARQGGMTALLYACRRGSDSDACVAALLSCPEVQRTAGEADGRGMTALMHAIESVAFWTEAGTETEAVIRSLIARPDVRRTAGAVCARGKTALMRACAQCSDACVAALLSCREVKHTAGVRDVCGLTALAYAQIRARRSSSTLKALEASTLETLQRTLEVPVAR
jgi:ankyrin repeat protein